MSFYVFFCHLQESYPSTPPIWFVDSDDPSLAQVLERLEDVRKGSTLVGIINCVVSLCHRGDRVDLEILCDNLLSINYSLRW